MLLFGFWNLKPCGQMHNDKPQVSAQKRGGQTRNTAGRKLRLLPNPRVALAVKRASNSSTWTSADAAQTKCVVSAISKRVRRGGIVALRWSVGRRGGTCMASAKSFCLPCTRSRTENVPSVAKRLPLYAGYTLTTVTGQAQSGAYFVTAVMSALGRFGTTLTFFSKQFGI